MRTVRSAVKILLIIIYTVSSYLFYWAGYLFLKLFGLSFYGLKNLYMTNWSRMMSLILNIRVTIKGTPPSPPFFLVSNHLTYLDIIPMYLSMKCTFVAKKEVLSWPVLGYMVKSMGVIFIDRTRKRDVTRVNEAYKSQLNSSQGIVIFPEGTTSGGDGILPFRASLLEYPSVNEIPVYFATIRYKTHPKDKPASETVCWFGAQSPFANHVFNMAGNRRIECTIQFGEEPVYSTERKTLARQLQTQVENQFIPMIQAESD